ncbi:DUF937 domain-containing protein [Quisquiliibacterium transsilvanicum]|jgi:hypothetical protein|uniref:DUF937 domain-containing protein n=1 Tax=Quisquiliibacterium transsilvanicum TaxID=1549638 RepID=A0A7W8M7V3_9BURK|nr:DUF937 domain-containing protein [Quisquiliibacterium transsilvanicum]MBB5271168.1 hypothetical protein [Quisquiliibacterium transsilvanicum]
MNILETILSAQGGGGVRQMADRLGLEQGQAQSAIEALLPMLAGAVSRNAQQPGGLEGLLGALSDGHHQRYLDDPSTLQDESTVQDGNAILGHLFGDREVSRQAAERASAQTGIGADVLRKMLPMLAALLMGGLSKGASQGGMFGSPTAGQGGLGDALGGALGGGAGGGLGQVLGGLLGGGQRPGLGQAQPQAGGGLLEMLTPMLDRNRDGSAMDDILGMAAQFLQRR